jgi:hypothetical protein
MISSWRGFRWRSGSGGGGGEGCEGEIWAEGPLMAVLRFIKVVAAKPANIHRSAGYWPDQSSHPLCFWRIKRSAPSGWH